MENRWGTGPEKGSDPLDLLVHLSRAVGADPALVQPGGGNTSVKSRRENRFGEEEEVLLVKGSGADLAAIDRDGFTALSLERLAGLRGRGEMTDEAMLEFMRSCMLFPHRDPFPSVETPLHSVLPFPAILHTHDVASLSLTDVPEETGRRLVDELFGGELIYVPYLRAGFPLAKAVLETAEEIPEKAIGLALARHGLIVWGADPAGCYERLAGIVNRIEKFIAGRRKGRPGRPAPARSLPARGEREDRAAALLPVVRGFLGEPAGVVLQVDTADEVLKHLGAAGMRERAMRGMATPDHILIAGRLPLWIEIDFSSEPGTWAVAARAQLGAAREEYRGYHRRNAANGGEPIPDWAKVVLVPGLGLITAGRDVSAARAARLCYRAVLDTIAGAEAVDRFEFLSEPEVFHFEHWPLERRKLAAGNRAAGRLLLPGRVALIVGGGSGIGEASAQRFVEEGAHVVIADLDAGRAARVAASIESGHGGRAVSIGVDVRDEASVAAAVREAVLSFGGLDCLFYTAGLAPGFSSLEELGRDELQRQLDVHYLGALVAIREAAAVMKRQGTGGSIVCSVSKAALAPGPGAAAYGGSKAALQHVMRTAALEFGPDRIRVNAINADQIETPLFLRFAEARAKSRGRTLEEQLEEYRNRNALRVSLIPPRAVADLAVLLASEKFRYTTGDIITVDGGLPDAFPR